MHSTHIKLASISRQLSEIGAKIKSALQQATGGTPTPIGPRPLSGPGSRLTESENQDLLRMFKREDLYTVKQIADKHRVSRAAVYLAARSAGLTNRMRSGTESNAYPLDQLLSH